MSVNAIRKQSTDEEVTSLAKSLIKSWKKLLGIFLIYIYDLVYSNIELLNFFFSFSEYRCFEICTYNLGGGFSLTLEGSAF